MKIRYLVIALALSGCASVKSIVPWGRKPEDPVAAATEARLEARARVKPTPVGVAAATPASEPIRKSALSDRGLRILVSTAERSLWLLRDTTVLLYAPVAIGMSKDFVWAGKVYDFDTPHSKRKVLGKAPNPLWVPPDWHYFEKAAEQSLTPVQLKAKSVVKLADSTRIEVRGDQVGRVNQFGNFWPFTPGAEIIFEGKIFIPPLNSVQRKVPLVLGTHKLEIGNGYLIHGTDSEASIGDAVSHGCVRMYNQDIAALYDMVPVGTAVYIF